MLNTETEDFQINTFHLLMVSVLGIRFLCEVKIIKIFRKSIFCAWTIFLKNALFLSHKISRTAFFFCLRGFAHLFNFVYFLIYFHGHSFIFIIIIPWTFLYNYDSYECSVQTQVHDLKVSDQL